MLSLYYYIVCIKIPGFEVLDEVLLGGNNINMYKDKSNNI